MRVIAQAIQSLQMLQTSVEQSLEISDRLVKVLIVKNKLQGYEVRLPPLHHHFHLSHLSVSMRLCLYGCVVAGGLVVAAGGWRLAAGAATAEPAGGSAQAIRARRPALHFPGR